MGLDMYLYKETYIGGNYEHNRITGDIDLYRNGEKLPIQLNRLSSVTEEVAYWRKANQIHKWFVDNVQNGNDDCGTYTVTRQQLYTLVNLCKRVLSTRYKNDANLGDLNVGSTDIEDYGKLNKENYDDSMKIATELLPTQVGCFFGDTAYDEYYYGQLEDTIHMIEPIIAKIDDKDWNVSFKYSSSW